MTNCTDKKNTHKDLSGQDTAQILQAILDNQLIIKQLAPFRNQTATLVRAGFVKATYELYWQNKKVKYASVDSSDIRKYAFDLRHPPFFICVFEFKKVEQEQYQAVILVRATGWRGDFWVKKVAKKWQIVKTSSGYI